MAAIAKNVLRKVPFTNTESDALTTIGLLCAGGLSISLLLAAYGTDLGAGFF